MTRLLLVLVSSLPAVALLAQTPATSDELRGRAVGEIRNRKGEPWAGAEVVLLSRPLPSDPNIGDPDHVIATTDGQGRFSAPILRGRPYSVWAWGGPTPEGRPATPVTENVFVQRPVVVREDRLLPARRVVLTELDRWPDCSFELRVVDQTRNRRVTWVTVQEGAAAMPFLVGDHAFLEVLGRQGEVRIPLARVRVAAKDPAGDLRIDLPARETVTCWAREAGSGKPCGGAIVYRRLGGALHAAGRTDAAGKLSLDVAKVGWQQSNFDTLTLAEGQGLGICAQLRDELPAGTRLDLPKGAKVGDHFANMIPGETQHLRVIGLGGKPLAGLTVLCCGEAFSRPTFGGAMLDHVTYSFTTDARGQVAVLGLRPSYYHNLHLMLRESDLASLPERWRSGLSPIVFAPLLGQAGKGSADDPITVDLRSLCPVELRLTEEGGLPAADVELGFTSLLQDSYVRSPWGNDDVPADQLGRLRLLVPGRQHLGFRAARGMSLLIRGFETTVGREGDGPVVARFQMPPPAGIRGRVLNPDGGPGRGRTVHASCDRNDVIDWGYATDPASKLDDAAHNRLRLLLPETERGRLFMQYLMSRQFDTDEEGCFAIPLPSVPIPSLELCTARTSVRQLFHRQRFTWKGESLDDIVLRAAM